MLLLLFGSVVGIINGLFMDFYLWVALCFLSLLLCYLLKIKFEYRYILFYLFAMIFFVYTQSQLQMYDTKYKEGEFKDTYKIISNAKEANYQTKYICKNSKNDKFLIYIPGNVILKKGDKIEASGNFVLPDKVRNRGGFNYRRYLNSQKIFGSIFVKDFFITSVGNFNIIYYIQEEINKTFEKLFSKNEMGLALGMMIGDTNSLSDDVLEAFKVTGITHLVAVSGSNVMYVLVCVQFLFKKIIGKRYTYYISIFFIFIFMLISGSSSSVIRATIMTTLMIIAELVYKKSDTIFNISVSAFVLMIISPLIVYDVGFILSFGGTLGIVLLSKKMEKIFERFGKLSETLAVTCSAQLVLMPIMAYYFNTFSILSILTNLIVAPMAGSITILGFAVFVLSKIFYPLAIIFSKPLYMLTHLTIAISQFFSKIPFSNVNVITPNIFEIVLFYFVLYVIFKDKKISYEKLKHKWIRRK